MDWMQFVSSLADSLAWPIAAVWIVFLFRKALTDRIPALLKLTFPGGSAEFGPALDEVEAPDPDTPISFTSSTDAQSESASSTTEVGGGIRATPPTGQPESPSVDNLALRANPTGVVMESWKEMEVAIRSLAKAKFPNKIIPRQIEMLVRFLTNEGIISASEFENIKKMKVLRNLAAHSSNEIAEDDAKRFKELAYLFTRAFHIRARSNQ